MRRREVLILVLVLFLEGLALAWYNDYASCARSNDVRRNFNLRGVMLVSAGHVSVYPIRTLSCVRVIPGT